MILFLLCLLFGVATTMYLQPQINIDIHTDNTTQVEYKQRDNYYNEGRFTIEYDFGAFASQGYWMNMIRNLKAENYMFQGLTSQVSSYEILNSNGTPYRMANDIWENAVVYSYSNGDWVESSNRLMGAMLTCYKLDNDYNHLRVGLTYSFMVGMYTANINYTCEYFVDELDAEKYLISVSANDYFDNNMSGCILSMQKGYNDFALYPYYDTTADYDAGFYNGYNSGVNEGQQIGYTNGYNDAKAVYEDVDATANSIFGGIFSIGLLPVNVFLKIFDWDVFGINVAGFVSGLLSIAVIVIILRFVLGRKE